MSRVQGCTGRIHTCCSAVMMSRPYILRLFLEKRGILVRLFSSCSVPGLARASASTVGPSRILCCRPAHGCVPIQHARCDADIDMQHPLQARLLHMARDQSMQML